MQSESISLRRGLTGLSPVIIFLLLYVVVSFIAGDFYVMPFSVALLVASAWGIVISKGTIVERLEIYSRAAGHSNIIYMIWIFILAGAFASLAKEMGAGKTVNFKEHKGIEALAGAVKNAFGGYEADFAFQCTGSPAAHSNIYKFIRNGGGLCELGFFINGGDATINPHFDLCAKEITLVGSWVYTLRDYATTFDFIKRAKAIGLPLNKLVTHAFPLEEIDEAFKTNIRMEGLKIAVINK